MKNIFEQNAELYNDYNLGLIPIVKAEKRPIYNDWSKYCKVKPTEEEIETWVKKNPVANIGLPLGEANGVIGFDLDTDNPEIKEIVERIIPKSPVMRWGKKGYISFYRFSGQRNRKFPTTGSPFFELLSSGRQCILPPSIHPETKRPYIWLTDDKLPEFDVDELPEFKEEVFDEIIREISKAFPELVEKQKKEIGGRNNFLKTFVASRFDTIPLDKLIEETVLMDKMKHGNKSLFSDIKEYPKEKFETPLDAARFFVLSMSKSITDQKQQRESSTDPLEKYTTMINGFHFREEREVKGEVRTIDVPDYYGYADFMSEHERLISNDAYSFIYKDNFYQNIGFLELDMICTKLTKHKVKPTNIHHFRRMALVNAIYNEKKLKPTSGFINLKNGVLDIKTRTLLDHSPDYYFKYCLKHDYNETATCPKFIEFLDFIFEGDQEQIDVTFEIFGYCLLGGYQFLHKAFVLYGTGRNGKSTWIQVLHSLLGSENVSSVSLGQLDKPFSIVSLDGKLANCTDETPSGVINAEAFKTATSSGYLRAAHKGKPEFDLMIESRFIQATNSTPNFKDTNDGMIERLFFMSFNKYIEPGKRDPNVAKRIIENELSGILNRSLEGLDRLLKRGKLPNTKAHDEVMNQYRSESDSVYEWFDQNVDVDFNSKELSQTNKEIYDNYKGYIEFSGRRVLAKQTFFKRFNVILKKKAGTDLSFKSNGTRGYKYIVFNAYYSPKKKYEENK